MNFLRSKACVFVVLLCLAILGGVVWYCLAGSRGQPVMDGTLVMESLRALRFA